MNELQISKLNSLVDAKKSRMLKMKTEEGINATKKEMLKMMAYLRACGYKLPDGEPEFTAGVWAEQLSVHIVNYGFETIWKAVRTFTQNDSNEYRRFPSPAQIIRVAKDIGFDPDVELARMKYAEELKKLEAEKDEEVREKITPEIREKFMREHPNIATVVKEITDD